MCSHVARLGPVGGPSALQCCQGTVQGRARLHHPSLLLVIHVCVTVLAAQEVMEPGLQVPCWPVGSRNLRFVGSSGITLPSCPEFLLTSPKLDMEAPLSPEFAQHLTRDRPPDIPIWLGRESGHRLAGVSYPMIVLACLHMVTRSAHSNISSTGGSGSLQYQHGLVHGETFERICVSFSICYKITKVT